MISVRQLAHACVMTHDLKAAEEFYVGVLGLERTFDFNRPTGRMGFYLAAGGRITAPAHRVPHARPTSSVGGEGSGQAA